MKRVLCAGMLAVAIGCQKAAVEWREPTSVVMRAPTAEALALVPRHRVFDVTTLASIDGAKMCPRSLATSFPRVIFGDRPASIKPLYAAWWSVRPDSDAVLFVAKSDDEGKTWSAPAVVDTGDVSHQGCNRSSPSIAVLGDYVFTAYSMHASEGIGVFETHSMDGGKTFHSTVPVMYGDREVAVSVAADSQFVVVAYEEPNGSRNRVAVAISRSLGHLFESQTIASTDVEPAYLPSVRVGSNVLVVEWTNKPGCTQPECPRLTRTGFIQ